LDTIFVWHIYVLCRKEVVILLEDGSQQTSIGKSELFKSMAAVQICPYPINSLLNLQYNLSAAKPHTFFFIVKARFIVSLQWSRFIEFYSAYCFSNFCLVIGFSPIFFSNVAIHVRTLLDVLASLFFFCFTNFFYSFLI